MTLPILHQCVSHTCLSYAPVLVSHAKAHGVHCGLVRMDFVVIIQVYHLASVRMRDLCDRLEVDAEMCSQIWTCFEHCLMQHADLMKGRHLDQIMMCSIYVMAKVCVPTSTFTAPFYLVAGNFNQCCCSYVCPSVRFVCCQPRHRPRSDLISLGGYTALWRATWCHRATCNDPLLWAGLIVFTYIGAVCLF